MQLHKRFPLKHIFCFCLFSLFVNLTGCGNKSDLYMPGNSPEDKLIKKTKDQVKSNDILSPSQKNNEVDEKHYEKENQAPVQSSKQDTN